MFYVAESSSALPSWAFPAVVIGVVATFLWNSVMSIVLYRMSKADRDVEGLKAELHNTSTKLLDERDRRISHQLANHAQQVTSAIDQTRVHAEQFDARLRELSDGTPKLQLEFVKAMGEAREFVRMNAADKTEFREFCDEVRRGREELLQAVSKLERQVVTGDDLRKILQEVRREK